MLALSPEAVLRMWRRGELPGFRLSSRVLRFRESEILEWLEQRRCGPTARNHELHVVGSLPQGR